MSDRGLRLVGSLPVLLMLCFASCQLQLQPSESDPAPRIQALRLGNPLVRVTHGCRGKVGPCQTTPVAFEMAGQLLALSCQPHQQVRKGESLARLDPSEWQARLAAAEKESSETQARIELLQTADRPGELRKLKSAEASSERRVKEAQTELKRLQKLQGKRAATRQEVDSAQRAISKARDEHATATRNLAIATRPSRPQELQAARARLAEAQRRLREARSALARTELKAPYDGTVVATLVQPRQSVSAGQPVVHLVRSDALEIALQLPQSQLERITHDPMRTSATATVAAVPGRKFEARVHWPSRTADAPTSGPVRVTIAQVAGMRIPIGSDAEVKFSRPIDNITSNPVFELPATAVITNKIGRSHVWLIDPLTMRVEARYVEIRESCNADSFVVNGLEPGQLIAASGADQLREGMKVRPRTQTQLASDR